MSSVEYRFGPSFQWRDRDLELQYGPSGTDNQRRTVQSWERLLATSFCLIAKLSVRDAEPTGDPCEICGDVPYLDAAELVMALSGGELLPVGLICRACATEISAAFDMER